MPAGGCDNVGSGVAAGERREGSLPWIVIRSPSHGTAMADHSHIGYRLAPHSTVVEAGRLRLFAKATGETRPEYLDEDAARAAGHPALPAPPTFAFCLEMELPDPYAWFADVDIELGRVLHGSQTIRCLAPIYAGDRLHFESHVS